MERQNAGLSLTEDQTRGLDRMLLYLLAYFSTAERIALARELEVVTERIYSRHRESSFAEVERKAFYFRAKKRLNGEVVTKMTAERIAESDPRGEIKEWLRSIKSMASL